jgi:putative glycosyltransferase (TIGR04372 family)
MSHVVDELAGAFLAFFAYVVIAILCVVELFWRIRFSVISSDRIGKLAICPEIFMRKMDINGWPPRTSYFFFSYNPCNEQLQKMWSRVLVIFTGRILNTLIHRMLPILKDTRFYISIADNSLNYLEMATGKPHLTFTDEEDQLGKRLLAKMGIGKNDWFVCIYARSSNYLITARQENRVQINNFRNCSISNYIDAAHLVTSMGGYVLRMGSVVDEAINVNDAKIIDYANRFRSDFLDIYIPAKAKFFIGCNSGLSNVPQIFNVPTVWANHSSYAGVALGYKSLFAPMLLRDSKTGRVLTLKDILNFGIIPVESDLEGKVNYMQLDLNFVDANQHIEWLENTAYEILDITKDMFDLIEGRKELFEETAYLHDAYLAYYGESPHNSPYAARLGPRFALRHKSLILGRD